jgi:hypothetical protein
MRFWPRRRHKPGTDEASLPDAGDLEIRTPEPRRERTPGEALDLEMARNYRDRTMF